MNSQFQLGPTDMVTSNSSSVKEWGGYFGLTMTLANQFSKSDATNHNLVGACCRLRPARKLTEVFVAWPS
jgi:hypothetical protein